MTEEVIDPLNSEFDFDSLRPTDLQQFIGQEKVRQQINLILKAALQRQSPPDHILLSGPPGLGKTSLAMIVAKELGVPLRITSGPALERVGDLVAMLSNLIPGEVLFIDEIHRIARPVEEMLYLAMEDFRVDVVVGKGPGATSIPLDISPFTLIGATTRTGNLTGPLRDRFGFSAYMDFYSQEELAEIILRSANILQVRIDEEAARELAMRSRGTPRIANRLLKRVRDYAQLTKNKVINISSVATALEIYDVDNLGLDRLDRAVLHNIVVNFKGGPVGLSTLAVAVGEEPRTIEEVSEPFLVRLGLITRTPKGRVALAKAWDHLGLSLND